MPKRHVGNNGSLASPEIRRYTQTLIADLCQQYPEIDGIRVDWPEYPQYFLDDAFLDFGAPAQAAATRLASISNACGARPEISTAICTAS